MLCWNCGTENTANNSFCYQCGEVLRYLDKLDLNPDYKTNYTNKYFIEKKNVKSIKFRVFVNNQEKYAIQSKMRLLTIILLFIVCLPVALLHEKVIIFTGQIGSQFQFSNNVIIILLFLNIIILTILFLLVVVIILIMTPASTILRDTIQDQTIGKGKAKGIRHKKLLFTGTNGTNRVSITFTTKTSGTLQCETGTYSFSKTDTGSPEIDLLTSTNDIIARFYLGPEYKMIRRSNSFVRKEFLLLSDETLPEQEILFFASAIVYKCHSRGRNLENKI